MSTDCKGYEQSVAKVLKKILKAPLLIEYSSVLANVLEPTAERC